MSVLGVVTAEMCQGKEDRDVMSKMVEEVDEVRGLPPRRLPLSLWNRTLCAITGRLRVFQVAGLQYKKFLAFPWILTVTWPMDTVSRTSLLKWNCPVICISSYFLSHA